MNYPVHVVNVAVDTTQGTTVVIRSGLQPGQQVVTDGQEKLQEGSRVIPRPSADMQAARQSRPNTGTGNNPDPNANAFSNGRGSDLDPAAAGKGVQRARQGNTGPNDATGLRRGSGNGDGATGNGTPNHAGGGHRSRPGNTNQ